MTLKFKICAGSFNLLYFTLDEVRDAISRFHLKHFVVFDLESGKECFHS